MALGVNSFEAILSPEELAELLQEQDRRSNKRVRFSKTAQISQLNCSGDSIWGTVTDLSRDGLYFTSRSDRYEVGMELRLIFEPDGSEFCCRVVRTESLPGGRTGVGASLIRL